MKARKEPVPEPPKPTVTLTLTLEEATALRDLHGNLQFYAIKEAAGVQGDDYALFRSVSTAVFETLKAVL